MNYGKPRKSPEAGTRKLPSFSKLTLRLEKTNENVSFFYYHTASKLGIRYRIEQLHAFSAWFVAARLLVGE